MYTLFAVSLDADSRVGYLSIALHKYSQSLLSAVPVLYCHLAASLILWEGEDPEIPLEPTRKRRAKASAGRQGVQAPCHSGVQDWAQPPITEAREAKINPSVLVAKNWWWWPWCHSRCSDICQEIEEGLKYTPLPEERHWRSEVTPEPLAIRMWQVSQALARTGLPTAILSKQRWERETMGGQRFQVSMVTLADSSHEVSCTCCCRSQLLGTGRTAGKNRW